MPRVFSQKWIFFEKTLIVQYRKEQPLLSYLKDRDKFIIDLLTIKSEIWKYENEYRIIEENQKEKNGELHKFPSSTLKSIYFGLNSSKEDIKNIIQLVIKTYRNNIHFYKMSIDSKRFALKKVKLNKELYLDWT